MKDGGRFRATGESVYGLDGRFDTAAYVGALGVEVMLLEVEAAALRAQ